MISYVISTFFHEHVALVGLGFCIPVFFFSCHKEVIASDSAAIYCVLVVSVTSRERCYFPLFFVLLLFVRLFVFE